MGDLRWEGFLAGLDLLCACAWPLQFDDRREHVPEIAVSADELDPDTLLPAAAILDVHDASFARFVGKAVDKQKLLAPFHAWRER